MGKEIDTRSEINITIVAELSNLCLVLLDSSASV